jgi:hypothetical protein
MPFGPTQPAGPPAIHLSSWSLPCGARRSALLSPTFFPFSLLLLRDGIEGAGRLPTPAMGAAPLQCWHRGMEATRPLCRIRTIRLCLGTGRRPITPTAPDSPCTALPLGDFSPKSIRHCTKNQRGRGGRRRTKGGRPAPPPRRRALGSRRGEAHPAGAPIGAPPRIRSRAERIEAIWPRGG